MIFLRFLSLKNCAPENGEKYTMPLSSKIGRTLLFVGVPTIP